MIKDLAQLREDIDAVDLEMTRLLEKRLKIVDQIAAYKKQHQLPIRDAAREAQVIEKNTGRLQSPQNKAACEQFFAAVMTISRERERH